MIFFLDINPPTATAQEKSVRIVGGRPIFYDPTPLKKAKALLIAHLGNHRPIVPLDGALELRTTWLFPVGKSHKSGEWRTTRPDTDNLQKMLKDCMTKCGYWKDDAQVVREIVEKQWAAAFTLRSSSWGFSVHQAAMEKDTATLQQEMR